MLLQTIVTSSAMEEWLTTRQVMDLLQLDRTTIYRMLNDGRLVGARVGGQWRFSHRAIQAILQDQPSAPRSSKPSGSNASRRSESDSSVLPLHCIQPIQEVFAETSQTASLLTTLDGDCLIPPSNTCAYCDLIRSTEQGRAQCRASWKKVGNPSSPHPRLERCHAGLTYAGTLIKVRGEPIAICLVGQFTTGATAPLREEVTRVAQKCSVDENMLWQARSLVHELPQEQAQRLPTLLQLLSGTYATIAEERLDMMVRLKKVAEIVELGVNE